MKEKTVNAKKIIIRFLLVITSLFLLLNGAWFYFRQHYYAEAAKNAKMTKSVTRINDQPHYELSIPIPESNSTARYSITYPQYLRFGSGYFATKEPNSYVEQDGKWINPFDFQIYLTIYPELFTKPRYQLSIYDYRSGKVDFLAGKTEDIKPKIYMFDINENMEITQEYTYGGRAVYDATYEDAYELFCRAKEVFGL